MDEIFSSIGKWFKEKTTSPLYGTFIFSVILWNWKFFYILFWQGEEKLPVPKIEYIKTILDQSFWMHSLYFLGLPLLSTYIIIRWLPIISNFAHKKHIEFFYERKLNFDEETLRYEQRKAETLSLISKEKKKQVAAKEEIEKSISEEEKWTDDYNMFIKNQSTKNLGQLKEVIYSNSGNTWKVFGNAFSRIIGADDLAVAHVNNLISIDGTGKNERIQLTNKGKFFLERFFTENKKNN